MVDTFAKVMRDDKNRKPGLREIEIDMIDIPPGRRAVELKKVSGLASSIKELGLLEPIGLTMGLSLIWGRHRLEACRSLGMKKIPAILSTMDAIHARLAEIDENLHRNELSKADRAVALVERKKIYEDLHPETKRGAAGVASRLGELTAETAVSQPSFVADTAERTGMSERQIRDYVAVGKTLDKRAFELIKGTRVEDNLTELTAMSKLSPDMQIKCAQAIKDEDVRNVSEFVASQQPKPSSDFAFTTGENVPPAPKQEDCLIKALHKSLDAWKTKGGNETLLRIGVDSWIEKNAT